MKTKFLAVAFAAAIPFAASADVTYNYADVSYQIGEVSVFDTDGFRLSLSHDVSDMWFVAFDYQSMGTDPDVGDVDTYDIFAGWHNDMFFAKVGYGSADYGGADDSGYVLDFGLRTEVSDNLEINGHVSYADYGDLDTFTTIGVGAVFMFSDNMGVSFNYDDTSNDFVDSNQYGVGFRFNF